MLNVQVIKRASSQQSVLLCLCIAVSTETLHVGTLLVGRHQVEHSCKSHPKLCTWHNHEVLKHGESQ